ncbi:MAG TPA: PP2C family protein-serine/threonine phosphatase [Dermatophilaceae bacterium]|nr:PP2C family protein-serine/threonine phosphatase [Dermatophilaceae bacterium]
MTAQGMAPATHRRRAGQVARALARAVTTTRIGSSMLSLALVVLSVGLAYLLFQFPEQTPWAVFTPVVVLAGLFLPPRFVAVVYAAVGVLLAYVGWLRPHADLTFVSDVLITALVAAAMLWLVMSRARLGVQGTLGESMLVDLRDRLRAHGVLPELPGPWAAEASVQAAYADTFSGDFVVANRSADGGRLELCLVDVSGKGVGAGTRSLLLSGALGGLLGAMEPDSFLPAANSYLLRQDWNEGFATAIHLALDLDTGDFSVGTAGHPPAVRFSAGSGRWELLDSQRGPVLGVLPGVEFPRSTGRLGRGDALLLYTDGIIEARSADLSVGIDRMLGTAERLVAQGFAGGAARICAAALGGNADDRAVIIVWRR